MTNPPQQPGAEGPYAPGGQQPPQPPPGYGSAPQQPGGYPPGAGQHQSGGHPPAGQPPPGYGPPPGGGQQGLGAQYPGPYSPQPPPQRKGRTGLIVGIVIAVVVLLAGGGVGLFFLLRDTNTDEPRAAAENLAEAMSKNDAAPLAPLTCEQPNDAESAGYNRATEQAPATYKVMEAPPVTEEADTALVMLSATSNKNDQQQQMALRLNRDEKSDTGWCADYAWNRYSEFGG